MVAKFLVFFMGVDALTMTAAAARKGPGVSVADVRLGIDTHRYLAFKLKNGRWAVCDPTSRVTRIVVALWAATRRASVPVGIAWYFAGVGERLDGALSFIGRLFRRFGGRTAVQAEGNVSFDPRKNLGDGAERVIRRVRTKPIQHFDAVRSPVTPASAIRQAARDIVRTIVPAAGAALTVLTTQPHVVPVVHPVALHSVGRVPASPARPTEVNRMATPTECVCPAIPTAEVPVGVPTDAPTSVLPTGSIGTPTAAGGQPSATSSGPTATLSSGGTVTTPPVTPTPDGTVTTPETTPSGSATATRGPLLLTVVPRTTFVVPSATATATARPTEESVTPIVLPTCPIPTPVASPTTEPTATAVPSIAPTATVPSSKAYACPGLERFVDTAMIEAALAHPEGVGGWDVRCNPNVPDSPFNGRRHSLTLLKPRSAYNPMANPLLYQCGCP